MVISGKQYGYMVQALAEVRRYGDMDDFNHRKVTETLRIVFGIKHLDQFFDRFDEEQLHIIAEALKDTAARRHQLFAYDAERMSEIAELVIEVKRQREAEWIERRYPGEMGYEAAI